MTKTTKPPGKQLVSNVSRLKPVPAMEQPPEVVDFVQTVRVALDSWASWVADTERGLITPAQLIALVLWVLQTEKTTESDERLIIEGWAKALLKACQQEVVFALHPVTLLPIEATHGQSDWVLSLNHAKWFLEAMPVGFDCIKILEHFRHQALELVVSTTEELTFAQVVSQRKANKSSAWTPAQKSAVYQEISTHGGVGVRKSVATSLGITVSTLNTTVPKNFKVMPSDSARPNLSGNDALQIAWKRTGSV